MLLSRGHLVVLSPPACPLCGSLKRVLELVEGAVLGQPWGPVRLLTVLSLQTKEALLKILGDMQPGDYFDLVLFGSRVQSWKGSLVQASEANLQAAKDFVRRFSLDEGKGGGLRPP